MHSAVEPEEESDEAGAIDGASQASGFLMTTSGA
jgi:hypothetical protein